ncbi:GNAT family N-acetyltransferase [Paenibacillus sp. CAU 1782]
MQELRAEDLLHLGAFGYRSTEKYELTVEESEHTFGLGLKLVQLDTPYIKSEMNEDEDIRRYGKLAQSGHAFGILLNDSLVALVVTEPQAWNNTLMIWHLQVHEAHQRKGFGRRLMEYVCRFAEEAGFRAVSLETQNTNVPAIRFYKRCGFSIEAIDKSLYSNNDDGSGEAALFMRKKLKA